MRFQRCVKREKPGPCSGGKCPAREPLSTCRECSHLHGLGHCSRQHVIMTFRIIAVFLLITSGLAMSVVHQRRFNVGRSMRLQTREIFQRFCEKNTWSDKNEDRTWRSSSTNTGRDQSATRLPTELQAQQSGRRKLEESIFTVVFLPITQRQVEV